MSIWRSYPDGVALSDMTAVGLQTVTITDTTRCIFHGDIFAFVFN